MAATGISGAGLYADVLNEDDTYGEVIVEDIDVEPDTFNGDMPGSGTDLGVVHSTVQKGVTSSSAAYEDADEGDAEDGEYLDVGGNSDVRC